MRWVRVDTGALRHEKLYSISASRPRAVVGWLGGLLLAGEQESGGFISQAQLELTRARPQDAELLVSRGLWTPVDGGWAIHDWDVYQPSTMTTKALRERGEKGARGRWHPEGVDDASS